MKIGMLSESALTGGKVNRIPTLLSRRVWE